MKMNKIYIKFMADEAIETLRSNLTLVTQKLRDNPTNSKWLKDFIPDEIYVTKKFEIEDFVMKQPRNSKDREAEIHNSILLYEHLKDLPMYILTDERFWCWLNFEKGYEVALKYMPITDGVSVFNDHWLFTKGNRRGLFFGVLSRSFFRVFLTVDPTLSDKFEYTKFVIEKPERFRNFSWRSYSSEKKIVLGALKAEKRVLELLHMEEKTKYFTELAKNLSQFGSIMLLDAMSEKDVENFVYKKYFDMVAADLRALIPIKR